MKVRLIDDNFEPTVFNQKAVHPMQTWEWGEAKKFLGNKVFRIGEFENDTLINTFQLTLHPIPKTPYFVAYLPRSLLPSAQTVEYLKEFSQKNNVVFVKIEPNIEKKDFEVKASNILIKSTHPLFPSWTQMLDLKPSVEELLANLKSKTRYNIRLAEKKRVHVEEESNDKGFAIFSKLYFETTKRQKYFGHDQHYHQTIWDFMKKGMAHILVAYFEETPLAVYELFYFNKILYYPYGGSSNQHRNLMGANLLMWKSIELGKKLGAEKYDMWGSLPPDYDQNDPWAGFTRFKEGYNTHFTEFIGTYDIVVNKPMYHFYGVLHKVRGIFLRLRA